MRINKNSEPNKYQWLPFFTAVFFSLVGGWIGSSMFARIDIFSLISSFVASSDAIYLACIFLPAVGVGLVTTNIAFRSKSIKIAMIVAIVGGLAIGWLSIFVLWFITFT